MRKIICTLLTIALVGSVGAPSALAACRSRVSQDCPGQSAYCLDCGQFTDEDQDGICDNHDSLCKSCGEEKHEGLCGSSQQKQSTVKESGQSGSRHSGHHKSGQKHH